MVGSSMEPIKFNRVDLTHPDGPASGVNSPGFISRLMSVKALTSDFASG